MAEDLSSQAAAQGVAEQEKAPAATGTADNAQGATSSVEQQTDARLSAENAKWRRQVRDLESKLQEISNEKLSEQEKIAQRLATAEKRATDAEQRLRTQTLEMAIRASAQRQGAVDPEVISKLLDHTVLTIEDDGSIKDLDRLIGGLLKDKPYLRGAALSGATNGARNGQVAETAESRRQRLWGGNASDLYDPRLSANRGGGVIYQKDK